MAAWARVCVSLALVGLTSACTAAPGSSVGSGTAAASAGTEPSRSAPPTITAAAGSDPLVVRFERHTFISPAGYVRVGTGTHVVPAHYATVTTFTAPGTGSPAAYILAVQLDVAVPVEHALTIRSWCDSGRLVPGRPHAYASGQVLLSSQNPVPGATKAEAGSRHIYGRALVELPPGGGRCILELAPRTEGVTGSRLDVVRGAASLRPVDVVAIGIQGTRVLVGVHHSTRPVRVAVSAAQASPTGPLTAHGEVEVTDCYGTSMYGTCPVTAFDSSTVSTRLAIGRIDAAGSLCRISFGPARSITVSPYEHHAKLILAPFTEPRVTPCGPRARTWIEVTHVAGNEMQVEAPVSPGQPLTLSWLDR
jgi:hypothetical protein